MIVEEVLLFWYLLQASIVKHQAGEMMEYNNFTDGLVEHRSRIINSIKRSGLYVHQDGNCYYTVGMSILNFPELVLFNKPVEYATQTFTDIYSCVKHGNVMSIKDYVEHHPFSTVLNGFSITEETKKALFWSARLFYGNWDFDVKKLELNKAF